MVTLNLLVHKATVRECVSRELAAQSLSSCSAPAIESKREGFSPLEMVSHTNRYVRIFSSFL